MITYYIGNIREKRKLFNDRKEGKAVADNRDVLADFGFNGKVCMVLGGIPFGDMRVGEYVLYACALKPVRPDSSDKVKALLRRAGLNIPLCKKMSALSRLQYRCVLLATEIGDDTREVWLNLDGIAYSPLTKLSAVAALKRLSAHFDNVHVSVSDYRFIPASARSIAVTARGMIPGKPRSASRRFGKLHFSRKTREESIVLSALCGRKTILCDG